MPREYREVSYLQEPGKPETGLTVDSTLTFEDDGTAYRRISSRETADFIDVAVTGSALDYERRLLEVKQQMAEADDLAQETTRPR